MSYVWLSVFVFGFVLGGPNGSVLAAASHLATSDISLLQDQAQPPPSAGDTSQDAPKKRAGQKPRVKLGPGAAPAMGPQEEAEEEIQLPTGPMRIEPYAVSESRVRYREGAAEAAASSKLRLQVTLTGERLKDIVGLGHLVIEEAIDDTGAVLAAPENIQKRDRSATSPVRITKRVLKRGFVTSMAELPAPAREARKLAKVTGWINVVYGDGTENILVDNPLQYLGGYLKHPRLEELGMNIRVIEPGDEVDEQREGQGVALQFERCAKQVRNTEFFDAWLKPMYPRARRVETPDGEDYMYYGVMPGVAKVDADTQMILTVWPEIEEERIRFSFENIELP